MGKPLEIKVRLDRSQAKAQAADHIADAKKMTDASAAQVADQKKGIGEVLSATQVAERAKIELINRGNRERIDAAKKAMQADQEGMKKSAEAGMGLYGSLKSIALQYGGLQLIGQAASAIATVMKEAREHADKLAADFISQRDSLREIAAITGGKSDKTLTLNTAKFNVATALRPDESNKFVTEFLNSGAQNIGPGKSLGNAEGEKYKVLTGQMAAAKGIDPGVVGNLAGSTLAFTNFAAKGQGANEAATKLNRALMVLGAGQGDNAVMARQLQMLSASTVSEDDLKGVFKSPEEAGIAVSVGAEKHDAQSAELVKAYIRGMYDMNGKGSGVLKAAGIDKKDSFFDRTQKMADYLDKEAVAKGERPGDFLGDTFDDLTKDAILTFYNRGVKGGVIKSRKDFLATPEMSDPNQVSKLVKDFQTDPEGAGVDRVAEARKKEVESRIGAERAPLVTLRKQAEAIYEDSGLEKDPLWMAWRGFGGMASWISMGAVGVDPKEQAIRKTMGGLIDQRRQAQLGFAPMKNDPGSPLAGYGGSYSAVGSDNAMLESMNQMKAMGGNPLVDLVTELKGLKDATKDNTAEMKAAKLKQQGQKAPVGAIGVPGVPPVGGI